jgi:hypothetical protein
MAWNDDTDKNDTPNIFPKDDHASNGFSSDKPKIEVGADGYIGRDLAIKATKKPPKTKDLVFPEWTDWAGAKYKIKELRGGEKSRIDSSMVKGKVGEATVDTSEQDAKLIMAASINPDGTPMWNPRNKDDLKYVLDFPSSVTEFLTDEIRALFSKPKDQRDNEQDALGNSTSTASSN